MVSRAQTRPERATGAGAAWPAGVSRRRHLFASASNSLCWFDHVRRLVRSSRQWPRDAPLSTALVTCRDMAHRAYSRALQRCEHQWTHVVCVLDAQRAVQTACITAYSVRVRILTLNRLVHKSLCTSELVPSCWGCRSCCACADVILQVCKLHDCRHSTRQPATHFSPRFWERQDRRP